MLRHQPPEQGDPREQIHRAFVAAENLHRPRPQCRGQGFAGLVRIDRGITFFRQNQIAIPHDTAADDTLPVFVEQG